MIIKNIFYLFFIFWKLQSGRPEEDTGEESMGRNWETRRKKEKQRERQGSQKEKKKLNFNYEMIFDCLKLGKK